MTVGYGWSNGWSNVFVSSFLPTELDSKQELVQGIRKFLQSLPRAVIIVIRYLFAFLNQ